MKKVVCVILILVFILSACSADSKIKETPKESIIGIVPIELDISEPDNSLTLFLMNSVVNKNDQLMGGYMSELMAQAGFDLEVKFYNFDYSDRQKSIIGLNSLIRNEIEKGRNLLIETRSNYLKELDSENLLYYFDENSINPYITVGSRKNYRYTGVYIDKSIEEKYGRSIENTTEYGEFMAWVSNNEPDKIPGLIVMQGGPGETFNPIALFAQEAGYVRADWGIGSMSEGGTTLYLDLEAIGQADQFTPMVAQAANLPFFFDMDNALEQWSSKGYINFKSLGDPIKFENYASLVLNVQDTTEYYSYDNQSSYWKLKDVSDFNLHIFTKDGTFSDTPLAMDLGYSGKFAISAKSPSVDTIVNFLEWIYSSTDNYLLFMCGKEGTDYIIKDDEILFLVNFEKNIKYGEWYKHTSFIEPEIDLVMPHFPANWKEVKDKLSDVSSIDIINTIGYDKIDVDISKIINETVFNANLKSAYISEVTSKYERYFNSFGKSERDYNAQDLRSGIEKSTAAEQKKKAYEELLSAITGN